MFLSLSLTDGTAFMSSRLRLGFVKGLALQFPRRASPNFGVKVDATAKSEGRGEPLARFSWWRIEKCKRVAAARNAYSCRCYKVATCETDCATRLPIGIENLSPSKSHSLRESVTDKRAPTLRRRLERWRGTGHILIRNKPSKACDLHRPSEAWQPADEQASFFYRPASQVIQTRHRSNANSTSRLFDAQRAFVALGYGGCGPLGCQRQLARYAILAPLASGVLPPRPSCGVRPCPPGRSILNRVPRPQQSSLALQNFAGLVNGGGTQSTLARVEKWRITLIPMHQLCCFRFLEPLLPS